MVAVRNIGIRSFLTEYHSGPLPGLIREALDLSQEVGHSEMGQDSTALPTPTLAGAR